MEITVHPWMNDKENVVYMKVCSLISDFLRPPWTVGYQAPLSMGFSRQEY